MEFEAPQLDPKVVRRVVLVGGLILALALLSRAIGVKKMQADQVAVIVNNLSGEMRMHKKVGAIVYCPYFQDVYLLDKTRQTLEMTAQVGRGARQGKDDVKIKTIDGSDVAVDITINYEINPEEAVQIALTSGPKEEYKHKWIRDYARSICRTEFGELTTEEFYDSELRRQKAGEALDSLNKSLNPWGIIVTDVIPQDFSFYEEYQDKIKEKKLADQEIEEEKSKAKAANENQKRVRIEETKRMEVQVARFDGEMQKQRIEAEAAAEKTMREAEAYAIRIEAEAEAEFIRLKNEAKGVLATKKAEAEGIKALADAFKGPGGMNLVRMEYAKRLRELKLTGTPVWIDNKMEKLELNEAGAAASRRTRPRPAP